MTVFKSERVALNGGAEDVYYKLTHPEALGNLIEKASQMTEAQKKAGNVPDNIDDILKSITISEDSIQITGGPTGGITLRRSKCVEPTSIEYAGEQTPIHLKVVFDIVPGNESCTAEVSVHADIPVFVRPMIAGPMQKMVNTFAKLLQGVANWK